MLPTLGALEAAVSILYFILYDRAGPVTFLASQNTIKVQGGLLLAAGACAVAAGLRRRAAYRLLALHGLALGAFGLLHFFTRFRISFLTFALLIVVAAMSIGILELATARSARRDGQAADGWFLDLAGAASIGFAMAFLALGLKWLEIEPGSRAELLWLGSYFGFSAICMLRLPAAR